MGVRTIWQEKPQAKLRRTDSGAMAVPALQILVALDSTVVKVTKGSDLPLILPSAKDTRSR